MVDEMRAYSVPENTLFARRAAAMSLIPARELAAVVESVGKAENRSGCRVSRVEVRGTIARGDFAE